MPSPTFCVAFVLCSINSNRFQTYTLKTKNDRKRCYINVYGHLFISYRVQFLLKNVPGGIRTPDPQLRRLLLYPTELLRQLRLATIDCQRQILL